MRPSRSQPRPPNTRQKRQHPPRHKQLDLIPGFARLSPEHGGSLRKGMRKTARAIDPKQALHVVLRSSKARGAWSMLHPRYRTRVDESVRRIARRHGVRLYRYANVGNHLHLLVRARTRIAIQRFLKEAPGVVASLITGAKKGKSLEKNEAGRSFWDQLAYSRIVAWGRDFENLEIYFIQNLFEAEGYLTKKMKALGVRPIPLVGWGAPS